MRNIFENDELSSPLIGWTTSTETYAHGSIINPPRWRWTVGDGGSVVNNINSGCLLFEVLSKHMDLLLHSLSPLGYGSGSLLTL